MYIHTLKITFIHKRLQFCLPSFLVPLFQLQRASLAPSFAAPAEPGVSFPILGFLSQSSLAFYPQTLLWRKKNTL